MASGNPLLAVHYSTDNVIRTYELISGSFVLLGSSPFTYSGTSPRNSLPLRWMNESRRLLQVYGSAGRLIVNSYDITGANVTALSNEFLSSTSSMSFTLSYAKGSNQFIVASSVSTKDAQNFMIGPNGAVVLSRTAMPTYPVTPTSSAITYNGEKYIMAASGTTHDMYTRTTGTTYTRTSFTSMEGTSGSWLTETGSHLILRNANSTKASIYTVNGTTVTFVADFITLASGVINDVVIARNTKDIYVVTTVSGVTRTNRYQRYGDYPILKETFNNFGSSLSVTGDGLNLVDSLSKKMMSFNGTSWVTNDAAMTAITAGGSSQILSDHVFQQITETSIYNEGLGTLIENGTTDDFRIHLLDSTTPIFNATNTTVNQATNNGASIITSGNLPQAGITVPQLSAEYAGNRFRITSGPVKHPVVNSFINVRYALLYNYTTGKPILRFDFGVDRIVPVGVYLTLTFLDDNVIVID